jgi:hypothetical protein
MRCLAVAILLTCLAASGASAGQSCKDQAMQKKLAGAALNSFTKKCETDAAAACDKAAADKKLSGAAKTSFTTRCRKDASGT